MSAPIEVTVPDIGDFKDVEVIEVLTAPGRRIEAGESVITLESDKATLEIPSLCAGIVEAIVVNVGDRVSEGSPILTVEETATGPAMGGTLPIPPNAPRPSEPDAALAAPRSPPQASPAVRRLGRELGVRLEQVAGTGRKGRILPEDVSRFARGGPEPGALAAATPGADRQPPFPFAPSPEIDFSRFGPISTLPLTRIQKISGANLHRTWVTIPHVTHHDLADITDLEAFRRSLPKESESARVTLPAFLLKASVAALKAFPTFNAALAPDGENLILKRYYHIGVAVDTPEGLVVPVIRDVDQKGILALAEELATVSAKARENKLAPGDFQGGCFTLSSLGGIGGTGFTPILNAPEVAILGVARSSLQPVYLDGEFRPRRMLPLSLSFDHRVIDGAKGARFTTFLCSLLADVRRLLL
uniref:Dihydrolipoamide acetyltransferase component of pyruvate dehydrogenase complex n=1 Tax=Candidatus Kentrum eta TaxID=2126337 RepID=A0A450UEX9_9GAMM|nr:MAG: pyruvate dehydrogenase E2 component (dihydrolipoamide acetyltransferase) [Candidatus Kentron sp. H]VFJ91972.1 MAG: pyruvate dehydrogenase E2 component (dihydrolipoamide acetyltransferase) [Candidatus Kentron sp. H]VFJ98814.1 MAG: pyruvate dehydrogenase E2 component (dihydrolipoamide acetyltransferase) [Candidatus Kentron sp. H]